MPEYIKARFVGGQRHNQVIEVPRLNIIQSAKLTQVAVASITRAELEYEPPSIEEYRLERFVSEGGAQFRQYIHESLLKSGKPPAWTFSEAGMPRLPIGWHAEFCKRLQAAVKRRPGGVSRSGRQKP